ncbi:unnamed protein product [Mytilus edulis]|uniref:Apple domain-containing protein n=1 Tax=Mytilus edulis TaxID=6550 RepID=A0A8S3PTL6_MYTED|nr:unnamed protein product [Mytilus edulis]
MQSTTRYSYNSGLAVDGNFMTWSPDGYKCTHTYTLPTNDLSWWVVDLGSQYVVTNVVIYGRDDPCCSNWLQNYDIDIIDQPTCSCDKWSTFQRGRTFHCHYQPSSATGVNATCPSDIKGRFVRIRRRKNDFQLTLCEVEVYGELVKNTTEKYQHHIAKACGFSGKVYSGVSLQAEVKRSNIECTKQCIKQTGCCAAIYNQVTKECVLQRKSDKNEETTHSLQAGSNYSSFLV